ncbi:glycosyltransferase [Sporomusa acidovorans]|uniref:Glycosyltransferase 2-like domain-containing protein n=1 Tax=Sporomusa acidovorans (strain ATCC 49682 / DSM 3132 / Mol) TaxID=1123286 RepID=A0ABZ3J9E4_SPOA4|nr:glycosyltransferase [Sporomusa acidovorans]OZC15132.1 putative glycosyltransferase EpsH [Sporomusa acidovorans DSM 3132]SDF44284.1 Glycosyltransferase, GT2 family [Sporomusa acidovorans]
MDCSLGDNKQTEDSAGTDKCRTIPQGLTSIIVITYNKLEYNKLCIESIRHYTEPDSYELIVIDNRSTDGTVEWLQGQQDIKVILNSENAGFPVGCNQGIKAAKGNNILLLNNDTIVTPNWLTNLTKCLYSSSDIGAVGAVTNSCSNFQSIPCEYSSLEEMIRFAGQVNNSNPEFWEDRTRLVGYCLLIKAEIIKEIGLLDEDFSPGNYEDDDYCLRIRKAGYRLVLCRDTFIHHFGSVSFREQTNQYNSLLEVNRRKFTEKWGLPPHLAAPYQLTQDIAAGKWFTYQHEFSYYQHWIENTRRKFLSFIDQAEFSLLSGNMEKAVMLVKQAADYAYYSHPGFFVSPRLELILRKVAKKLSHRATIQLPPKSMEKKNILHVVSQGYAASSHARTIERWICTDSASVHSIIVTLNSATVPNWLVDAAIHSGGWYTKLDAAKLGLCQKAKVLRDAAAMWADVVVLHIHPHDPVAPIAFGVTGGPPVVFVNHADHAFTIGMNVADIIADQRVDGQRITLSSRNVNNSFILPIPLGITRNLIDKRAAKRGLGIDEDRIVFLTIALPYQLISCGEYSFPRLIRDLVNRHPNIEILVVGPSDIGEWSQLKRQSNGRIRCYDIRQDLDQFYSAADVYLDSVPVGSLVSAFEAGASGIPVVGLATDFAAQFSSEIVPGIVKTHFNSIQDLFMIIDNLVDDDAYRINQGNCLKTVILQNYFWGRSEHLDKLYSLLPKQHQPLEILDVMDRKIDTSDIIWAYFQHRSGLSHSSFG